jgi:hypothetical protein
MSEEVVEPCRYCSGRGFVLDPVLFVQVDCRKCEDEE